MRKRKWKPLWALRNKAFAFFERSSFFSRLWLFPLLYPIHWIWKSFAYLKKIRKRFSTPYQSTKTVVCIGNALSGGTGKTPFLLKLLESLTEKKRKIAVISRGYLSQLEKKEATVACYYEGPLFSPDVMGDEPFLICQKFPHILCVVGKDRLKAIKIAEKEADIILLDDGLQDFRIKPTFTIGMQGFASWGDSHFFLPLGRLRDFPFAKNEVDLLVTSEKKAESANQISIEMVIKSYFNHYTNQPSLPKGPIAAFSAISQPQRFFETLQQNQCNVQGTFVFSDHEKISLDLLQKFWEKQKKRGAQALVCTEKDWVKISSFSGLPFPIISTFSQIKFISGEPKYQLLIEKIVSHGHNSKN